MAKKKNAGRKADHQRRNATHPPRNAPLHIPLSFEDAMKGLLGLSPKDAKEVRDTEKKPRKK